MLYYNRYRFPMVSILQLSYNGQGEFVDPSSHRSFIGGLRYRTHTRSDIAYFVSITSHFMEKPTKKHQLAMKHILRYIEGTICLWLVNESWQKWCEYTDSDLARDTVDRRSTTSMAFYLIENIVTWSPQQYKCVAFLSCEAEFMATKSETFQGMWFAWCVNRKKISYI